MSDPAKYRTREEVQKMRDERDPIENIREMLLTGKHATEEDLKALDKEIKDIVNDSAEFAKDSPEPDLAELDWNRLDYLGWRDRKAPLAAYVVLELDGEPTGVLLRADARTPYQAVVTAQDALGQLGFRRIAIATAPEVRP